MNHPILTNPKDTLSLSYLGHSNDAVTTQLIGLSESFIQNNSSLKKLTKKVSFLIVESFQNVIRHGALNNASDGYPLEKDFFQICVRSDRVIISSKNLVEKQNVRELEEKIDLINGMDRAELKEFRKKSLMDGELSAKGGAGLGIIEMARKSGMPLKKAFVATDENNSQFFLGIEITDDQNDPEPQLDISELVDQYNAFSKFGLLLSYNGDFSGEAYSFLIEMLHNNFVDENQVDSRTIENVSVMIELIQNISKHGVFFKGQKPGMVYLCEKAGAQYIDCRNYITPDDHTKLKKLLETIQSKSLTELQDERKRRLVEEDLSSEGNGGLGLIEIGLFSANKFTYSFKESEGALLLFSIILKLK